jgi:hypothetical protein
VSRYLLTPQEGVREQARAFDLTSYPLEYAVAAVPNVTQRIERYVLVGVVVYCDRRNDDRNFVRRRTSLPLLGC